MEASLLLFMEKGYLKTTTQDIIDKVGISRGLLYYHFKNKQDILYCLIELYSEPLLSKLYAVTYDKGKSAIEKVKEFITITLISPTTITDEMIELQKTVDIEQNHYLMDKFAHNFIEKVTRYFCDIIEQGVLENVFIVDYPLETSYFLMTGYVFTANNINSLYLKEEKKGNDYLKAFEVILDRVLGTKHSIF